MISSTTSRIAGVIAGLTVLAVGCGDSNSDRAGGTRATEPIVLTMAQGNDGVPEQLVVPPALSAYSFNAQPTRPARVRGGA